MFRSAVCFRPQFLALCRRDFRQTKHLHYIGDKQYTLFTFRAHIHLLPLDTILHVHFIVLYFKTKLQEAANIVDS